MSQTADFFVSYTSADRAWAEWIAWQLEAEGYQVVVQAWDFRPGRDFVEQMHQVVEEAQRTIAVLSPAYLTSAFGGAEWRAVFAKDPTGERGLLLPVRVEEVQPPGLLTTRIYVDLVGKNTADARAALLAAARDARGKPAEEPQFPGVPRQSIIGTSAPPRFPGELPPVWNVPFHPNPFFTGRDPLLAELQTRLQAPKATVRRVVLTGLGGIGKTSVAVEYVYRHHADYDLVWCVNGEQPASLLADLAALAGQLSLAIDAPQEAQAVTLRGWLEHHQRWLLVIDNVDDPQAVAELLPRAATGQVVITSRTGIGWERLANVLVLDVLAPTDATALLLARTGETGSGAEAAAATLASKLGELPLALEQAGAYLASTGTVTLSSYAELFATRTLELFKRGQPVGYEHTVATTWSLALQGLRETEPAAVDLLTLASLLAPDDLPQPLLTAYSDQLPEPLAAAAADPLALADAVAALRRYSLVRVVADGLFVHRLLQTVVRAALDAAGYRSWTATVVRLLRVGFPDPSFEVANWPECQRLLPHALAAIGHGQDLDAEPEAWLWLLRQAATYLWSRGQYRQAVTLDQQALAGCRRLLGDDHPDTLHSMHNLGVTRRDLGDLQGSHQLLKQTLIARRRVLGDDDPDTLGSMNNLAETLRALGDFHEARQLHEQALPRYRKVHGDGHPDTLWSKHNLAETLRALGDLKGARELHEQTLADRRRVLGDDHPNTLLSMDNLAETLRALGDLQGSHQLLKQVLAARERVLGKDHPDTLSSMDNLVLIQRALGELHAAHDLHEKTRAARRRVLGDDHPSTLTTMNNLAETYRDLGDLASARELFEQTLDARHRVLGDDHPSTLDSMSCLAEARRALGDLQGALELHEQALAGRRRVLGDDHPSTLTTMNSLGLTYRVVGDLHLARDLFQQTLDARRRVLGDDHPLTLLTMSNLAETLRDLGDFQGAQDLHGQVLTARQQLLGDDHPDTLLSMNNLTEVRRQVNEL
jgi:tetratricopeptide (TPR) repeat protein